MKKNPNFVGTVFSFSKDDTVDNLKKPFFTAQLLLDPLPPPPEDYLPVFYVDLGKNYAHDLVGDIVVAWAKRVRVGFFLAPASEGKMRIDRMKLMP